MITYNTQLLYKKLLQPYKGEASNYLNKIIKDGGYFSVPLNDKDDRYTPHDVDVVLGKVYVDSREELTGILTSIRGLDLNEAKLKLEKTKNWIT